MLDVVDDNLCVDHKGIYSIENYLTSRRLMYWQVYLHKTTVAAERLLINTLHRAKDLVQHGADIFATPALRHFLENDVDRESFISNETTLRFYEQLDDNDIWTAIKVWAVSSDFILSLLSASLLNRKIFKVEVSAQPFEEEYINKKQEEIASALGIEIEETKYFMSQTVSKKDMYDINDDRISMLFNDGTLRDITDVSDLLNINLLSKKIGKYYLCYQRI